MHGLYLFLGMHFIYLLHFSSNGLGIWFLGWQIKKGKMHFRICLIKYEWLIS